ncbi:hypothetical protein BU15DRAFT_80663 [Melanogaster broomeanus]|nr:hypothetical protein BU15DRAFT_80663 [Melanogaster broomeanus]
MPPLHPHLRRSARLQQTLSNQLQVYSMASTGSRPRSTRGGGRGSKNSNPPRATANPPNPGPSASGSKAKTAPAKARALPPLQETHLPSSSQAKGFQVYWDHVPARTDTLVEYLLTHPADCHVLFNDKNTGNTTSKPQEIVEKPSGRTKKDIQAVIAKIIFEHDSAYAEAYQATPDKFQVCVGNRLTTLKATYRKYRARFKQSGEGIIPGHPKYSNLLETVNAEFPYYDDLHALWEGNPSYDPDLVSSEPKKNHAEDFLSLVKTKKAMPSKVASTTFVTPTPTDDAVEVDENPETDAAVNRDDREEPVGGDVGGDGFERIVPEEFDGHPRWDDQMRYQNDRGDEDQDNFEMDSQSIHQEQLESTPSYQHLHPPAIPKSKSKFTLPVKTRTPSWDGRQSFRQPSPYLRPPASTASGISTTTGTSGSSRKAGKLKTPWSNTSDTSSTKAGTAHVARRVKSELLGKISGFNEETESILAASSSGKTARYVAKMEYAKYDRELDFRREEWDVQRVEAEVLHLRNQEMKKLDIELKQVEGENLDKELLTLQLKIKLTELQKAASSSSS